MDIPAGRTRFLPPDEADQPKNYDLTNQSLVSTLFAEAVKKSLISISHTDADIFQSLAYNSNQTNHKSRDLLASFFSTHYKYPIGTENLVLTSGAQNSLASVLLSIFNPGDSIACEKFTYRGLRYAAKIARINLIPLEMDKSGIKADDLDGSIARYGIKGIVCVPNYQNPTALTMDRDRRQIIARIAKEHGIFLIEDDVYGLLSKNGIPSLYESYPEGTFLLNGFSKALGPGLRIGVIICHQRFNIPLSVAVRSTTWMPSQIDLAIIEKLIDDNQMARIINQNRERLDRRNKIFAEIFSGCNISFGAYSPHAIIHLPRGLRASAVLGWLRAENIHAESSEQFSVGVANDEFIRVNLTGVFSENALIHALNKISTAIHSDAELLDVVA